MNFNFCSFEKGVLTDEIRIIANQLFSLGHRAYEGSNFIRREFGYNIIVSNGKIDNEQHEAVLAAQTDGAVFLFLSRMGGRLYLGYGELLSPVILGYAKTLLAGVEHVPLDDFGVFGPLTPVARKTAKKLHRISNVRVVEKFTDIKHRDNEFLGVRVILQLNGEISDVMCNVALHVGRPVMAQWFEHQTVWNDIIKSSYPDTFIADCLKMRMTWKEDYQQQLVKFSSKLTPDVCIVEPFRKLGIDISTVKKSAIHI